MLPRKLIYTASIAALAFGVSQTSLAQSAATSPSTSANKPTATQSTGTAPAANLARGDRKFLEEAAQGGMAEVEMGRLATQRAGDASVREFGARMVSDHSAANAELKAIAAKKGMQLPSEVNSSQKSEIDKLSKMSGDEFDKEYMSAMVKDHEEDGKDFETQAKDGNDADIKAFAAKTLPKLQEHLNAL